MPPAPGRFSLTTGCPRPAPRCWPTSLAMMSLVPAPAAKGTSRRTGRFGQACASAACETSIVNRTAKVRIGALIYPSLYWPLMKLRVAENFRAVFYAPFYAIRALGLAEREGLAVEWLPSDAPGGTIGEVKRGAIDAQWGGPMRVLKDHDSPGATLVCFGEAAGRDPFYLIGRKNQPALRLQDIGAMRLGVVSEVPTPWYCLRADLEDAGVDTAAMRKAGRLVDNLTMPQQLEALAAGKLDAVQLFEPHASRALADGNAMLYAASSRGPTCYTTFITSRDSASKRREEFAALTRATQAVLDWLAEKGPAEL